MLDNNSMYAVMIITLIAGVSASFIAKHKGRNPLTWFLIAIFAPPIALFILCLLPSKLKQKEQKVPAETMPQQVKSEATSLPEDMGGELPNIQSRRLPTNQAIDWYFIDQNLETVGPLSIDQLRKAIIERHLDTSTYIWCEEFTDWTQISEFQNNSLLFDRDLL